MSLSGPGWDGRAAEPQAWIMNLELSKSGPVSVCCLNWPDQVIHLSLIHHAWRESATEGLLLANDACQTNRIGDASGVLAEQPSLCCVVMPQHPRGPNSRRLHPPPGWLEPAQDYSPCPLSRPVVLVSNVLLQCTYNTNIITSFVAQWPRLGWSCR